MSLDMEVMTRERHDGEDVWLVDDRWIDREVKSPTRNMFSKRASESESPLPAFLTTGSTLHLKSLGGQVRS